MTVTGRLQVLTFVRACPEFNSGMTVTGVILSTSWRIRQDDDSRAVILNLIQNLCYCQKTQILTFVRMTVRGSVRTMVKK